MSPSSAIELLRSKLLLLLILLLYCAADDRTTWWTVEVAVADLPRAFNASESFGRSLRKVKMVDSVSVATKEGGAMDRQRLDVILGKSTCREIF